MSLLTRKTKWALTGLAGFALAATTATTLATWVIGQNNASGEQGSTITVTDASKENVALTLNAITDVICFGPAVGDTEGNVKSDGEGEQQFSFTVSGTVTYGAQSGFNGLTLDFEVVEKSAEVAALVEKGYIVLPEDTEIALSQIGQDGSFSVTMSFGWGAAFGNENPSLYFDNSTNGTVEKSIAMAEAVRDELETIEGAKFKVTVTSK